MKSVVFLCAAFVVIATDIVSSQPQSPPHPNARPPPSPPQQQPPLDASQPSQPPPLPQNPQGEIELRCQSENGTVPHWHDNTCRTFLSCNNYTLSLESCEPLVYSYTTRTCVEAIEINCTEQNLKFGNIIRAFFEPHFYRNIPKPRLPLVPVTPDNANQFAAGAPVDDEDGEEEDDEEDDGGLTIDLNDLPSIIVDNTNAFNMTLPAAMCQKLGGSVHQLEVSMNAALLMLTGCPETACDVPLFSIDC